MKTSPDCFHCILKQAVSAVKRNETDPDIQIQTIRKVIEILAASDDRLSPSEIAGATNQAMREALGLDDLHQEEKENGHNLAMSYLEDLRNLAREGDDPLEQWLKISAAGNIIDIIHADDYDLWEEVRTTVNQDLSGPDLENFRKALLSAPHLLYLADNVGETVFDRVLIENLDIPVIYAVKSGPILNDASKEDAIRAGIDQVAEIVETGSRAPGTVLSQASESFRELFRNSTLVLSKGQANFETVDEQGEKVFFLLRMKCPVISERVGIPQGRLVLKQANPLN